MRSLDKYDRAVVRQFQDQVEALAVTVAGLEYVLPDLQLDVDWFGQEAVKDLRTLVRLTLNHFKMYSEGPPSENICYDSRRE